MALLFIYRLDWFLKLMNQIKASGKSLKVIFLTNAKGLSRKENDTLKEVCFGNLTSQLF